MSTAGSPSLHDFLSIVEMVADALLGAPAVLTPPNGDAAQTGPMWHASVRISGPFNGAVTVLCPAAFAKHAAVTMFTHEVVEQAPDESARDALAELANIIGGNIKALFSTESKTCTLSLPHVEFATAPAPGECIGEMWFNCAANRFGVLVSKREDGAAS